MAVLDVRVYKHSGHQCSECGDRRWPRRCGCDPAHVVDVVIFCIDVVIHVPGAWPDADARAFDVARVITRLPTQPTRMSA